MSIASGAIPHAAGHAGTEAKPARALGCVAVMLAAAWLLFVHLGDTRAPIWDEAYYLPSTARFHEGRLQFASHPPLGLMLIAAGDTLAGANRDVNHERIGAVKSIAGKDMPAAYDYVGPRLAPAGFGVIAAGLFFLLMCELTGSTGSGLMLSPLFLCDTAILAQARAAHLDPFQLAFVLAALLCLSRGLERASLRWPMLFGALVMAAALVRANAIVLAPLALFPAWTQARRHRWPAAILSLGAASAGAALMLVSMVYAYALASPQLPDAGTPAGAKDMAYVAPEIREAGHVDAGDLRVVLALAGDYARYMAADNRDMTRQDRNGSHPWQWLVGSGAVTYRWDASGDRVATIALVPNFAAWLLSLAGVLATLWSARRGLTRCEAALLSGWMLNMAALLWLDGNRVLYLYAYFLPLVFGHALAALAWRTRTISEGSVRLCLAAVTLSFLAAAPLAFHRQVPKAYCAVLLRECGDSDPSAM